MSWRTIQIMINTCEYKYECTNEGAFMYTRYSSKYIERFFRDC